MATPTTTEHEPAPPTSTSTAAPTPASPILEILRHLHQRFASVDDGAVATYIPELGKADPSLFGIAVATVDGQLYEVGDTRVPFTLQSMSKPLTYGIALNDRGPERVRRAVGVEPSGDAFNSISLEPSTGRPLNPIINAGAIATSGLVPGADRAGRLARLMHAFSTFAGRPLEIDESVYVSERDTGHRNRAISHLLRNYDVLEGDPEDSLDLYFRQCSVLVDCRDLAFIAATLAHGGVHPVTGERAVAAEHVGEILSVMTTCGMYDFAGAWVTRVGMPAKSGVGGGIIAVLPGQLGIGVFSPKLDERGNSVRGVQVCEAISKELGLHFLQPPQAAGFAVRARYTAAQVRSKRRRSAAESALLDAQGDSIVVHELQGDLRFATLEPVIRELAAAPPTLRHAVLDFKRVTHVDAAAMRLLARLVEMCAQREQVLVLCRVRRGPMLDGLGAEVHPRAIGAMQFQPQLDAALEWCERRLLARAGQARHARPLESLASHQLCAGLAPAEVEEFGRWLERRGVAPGDWVVRRGDAADALYLLLAGEVSVVVELPGGGTRRLTTLGPGMTFGETALTDGGVRTADIRADTPVECARLDRAAFAQLEREHPALVLRLMHNLLRNAVDTAARLTREVAALEA